jgi:hypothetical protein
MHVSWVVAMQPMQSLAYEIIYIAIVGLNVGPIPRDNPRTQVVSARYSQFETHEPNFPNQPHRAGRFAPEQHCTGTPGHVA